MSRIRSIVFGTSLFVALAFAIVGGTGINSTMAAPSATDGKGCIIAVLKSEKAQQVNAIAASGDDEPGCLIGGRKSGGIHTQDNLTVRKSGGDQHEYYN
jgi:hypothetical protein